MTRRSGLECFAGLAGAFSESTEDHGPGAIPQKFILRSKLRKVHGAGIYVLYELVIRCLFHSLFGLE